MCKRKTRSKSVAATPTEEQIAKIREIWKERGYGDISYEKYIDEANARLKKEEKALNKVLQKLKPSPWKQFYEWTGIREKKGWDFLTGLSIPITIFLGGTFFTYLNNNQQQSIANANREQDLKIADGKQKDEVLKNYFDNMTALLLDKDRPLLKSAEGDEIRSIARVRTLTALRQLNDGERKGLIIRFLYESKLVYSQDDKDKAIINMEGADLRGIALSGLYLGRLNLSNTNLENADLSKIETEDSRTNKGGYRAAIYAPNPINLTNANLAKANLEEADLTDGYLGYANLSHANLRRTWLGGAKLYRADLNGTRLDDTRLNGVDLSDANLLTRH